MPDVTGPGIGGSTGAPATFDALAELFLGDSAIVAPPLDGEPEDHAGSTDEPASGRDTVEPRGDDPDAPPSGVEAVIAGHLPVRAGPWVTQYAGASAEQTGMVIGLARLMGGHCFVDVFGLPEELRHGHERESVPEALAHAGELCERWIVQAEELDEHDLVDSLGIGAVTLLTGANDAAVVDAYRTIKALIGVERDGMGDGGGPRIGVAVMGVDEAEARHTLERVARASETFLSEPVALTGWIERMEPRAATPIFRGPTDLVPAELLAALSWTDRPSPMASPLRATPASAPREMESHAEPKPAAQQAETDDRAPAAAQAGVPGSLISFLDGLEALEIPYPDGGAEFAVDSDHRLHVLCRDTGDGRGLMAVSAAGAWARKHAALLTMALGPRRVDWGGAITLHLFAQRPKELLAAGVDVRLHALVRAQGGGWGSVELT